MWTKEGTTMLGHVAAGFLPARCAAAAHEAAPFCQGEPCPVRSQLRFARTSLVPFVRGSVLPGRALSRTFAAPFCRDEPRPVRSRLRFTGTSLVPNVRGSVLSGRASSRSFAAPFYRDEPR